MCYYSDMAGVQRIDVSSSTIFRTILILLLFWFLYLIRDILLVLFAALILAWAIEPLAQWLSKWKVPRGVTVVLVYVVGLAVLSGVVSLLVPPLARQVSGAAQSLPGIMTQVEEWVGVRGLSSDVVVGQVQTLLARFGESLANASVNIFQRTRTVFSGVLSVVFVFVLTFYLVIARNPLKRLFSLVLPKQHVAYAHRLLDRIQRQVGRWVLAQLVLGVIVGTIVGVGLWLLGVPFALLLGLIAGLFEIVPMIGPVLAAIPGVIVGVTQGWVLGLAALGLYWLTQQFENHVLVPNIMKRAVGLNPLVTLLAVLLGGRLVGVVGVILAVPVAVVVSVFVTDLFAKDERVK